MSDDQHDIDIVPQSSPLLAPAVNHTRARRPSLMLPLAGDKKHVNFRSLLFSSIRLTLWALTVTTVVHLCYTAVRIAINRSSSGTDISSADGQSYSFASLFAAYTNPKHTPQAATAYYTDCVQSFLDRRHPLNDGVSVKIGIFSYWSKTQTRQQIRDSYKRFIPDSDKVVNFRDYCQRQESRYRETHGDDSLNQLKQFVPVSSPYGEYQPVAFDYNGKCKRSQIIDYQYLSVYDNIQLTFVLGQLNNSDGNALLREALFTSEQARYSDLEFVNVSESVNGGKSLEYLQLHASINRGRKAQSSQWVSTGNYNYDFVMKLDDDSWLYLPRYIKELRQMRAARMREVYYGQFLHYPHTPIPPVEKPSVMPIWVAGAGYTMSDDLIEWLASPHFAGVKQRLVPILPDEDLLFGEWFKLRGKDLGRHANLHWNGHVNSDNGEESYRRHHSLLANSINMMPLIYNYPGDALTWSWMRQAQFHEQTIVVHYVKQPQWWDISTLHFMCNEPHTFHWRANETWWQTKEAKAGELYYLYKHNGEVVYSNHWFDDWHSSYRESHDEARGLIGGKRIVLRLGNLTRTGQQ